MTFFFYWIQVIVSDFGCMMNEFVTVRRGVDHIMGEDFQVSLGPVCHGPDESWASSWG